MSNRGLKKALIVGAALGAVITIGVAISMDYFLSGSLQGTWRDAAVKDVTRMFGPACGRSWLAVTFVLVVVMGFLAAFGSVLGAIAGAVLNRFFRLILK